MPVDGLLLRSLCPASKPHHRLVGSEVERFGCNSKGKVLRYEQHLRPVLEELHREKSWRISYQAGENILGLERAGHQISLEPGGQFEISPAPHPSLQKLRAAELDIEKEVLSMKSAKDWKFHWLGVNPFDRAEEIPLLPSPRYSLMTEYFKKQGGRGVEMMRLTSGCHLTIDYACEKEAVEMLRVGFFVSPLVTALFCHSPFYERKVAKRLSERAAIWWETDPKRSGVLDAVFKKDFEIKDYVNFVESLELMYFFDEEGKAIAGEGRSFKDLPKKLQESNSLPAMRQVFTDVRLKPMCVELRFFDQQNIELRYAAFAYVIGLLYDDKARSEISELALCSSAGEVRRQLQEAATHGLKNDSLYERIRKSLACAEKGLIRRGLQEENFLAPIEQLLSQRLTPAELELKNPAYASLK